MISTKYSKDYRQEVEKGPDGKMKDVFVYTGAYYKTDETEESHKRTRLILVAEGLLAVAAFIVGIYFNSSISHTFYAVVPYALNALNIYLLIESTIYYFPVREIYKKEEKEKGIDRIKTVGLLGSILFLISLAGALTKLFVFTVKASVGDHVFIVCNIVLLAVFISVFIAFKKINTKEFENPIEK